jgi:hypothetical protein
MNTQLTVMQVQSKQMLPRISGKPLSIMLLIDTSMRRNTIIFDHMKVYLAGKTPAGGLGLKKKSGGSYSSRGRSQSNRRHLDFQKLSLMFRVLNRNIAPRIS